MNDRVTPAAAGRKRVLGSFSTFEHPENLFDVGQAFLVVLALEFKPAGNPVRVANAMLRKTPQGQQIGPPRFARQLRSETVATTTR